MLHLRIVKRVGLIVCFFLAFLWGRGGVACAQGVAIRSPRKADVLHGQITITGNSDVPEFKLMSLHFAYQEDAPETWFLIFESQEPVREGPLATWDTTLISDGVYRLRMRVILEDDTILEDIVSDLIVGNNLPVPTRTAQGVEVATATALSVPTDPVETPTSLPPNPLQLSQEQLTGTIKTGAALVAVLMFLLLLYRTIRK